MKKINWVVTKLQRTNTETDGDDEGMMKIIIPKQIVKAVKI